MNMIRNWIILLMLFTFSNLGAQEWKYVTAELLPGEGAYAFLERYGLDRSASNVEKFKQINKLTDLSLYKDTRYKIPIKIYIYDGKSIRTSIGNNDYDYAVRIQQFNEGLSSSAIKPRDYRDDLELWVPDILPSASKSNTEESTTPSSRGIFPIFGKAFEQVDIQSTKLTGHVYYVVAGHGGPDPGAVVKYHGHQLCEDEYL